MHACACVRSCVRVCVYNSYTSAEDLLNSDQVMLLRRTDSVIRFSDSVICDAATDRAEDGQWPPMQLSHRRQMEHPHCLTDRRRPMFLQQRQLVEYRANEQRWRPEGQRHVGHAEVFQMCSRNYGTVNNDR